MSLEQKLDEIQQYMRSSVYFPDPDMLGDLAPEAPQTRVCIVRSLNKTLAAVLDCCKAGAYDENDVYTHMTKALNDLDDEFPGCNVHNKRLYVQVSMFFGVNYDVNWMDIMPA